MFIGMHALIYSSRAEEVRAFLRDVLELKSVDAGHGWLIFGLPPAELAVHPREDESAGGSTHELYLMCDDLDATMATLAARGVRFTGVTQAGFGRLTAIILPDDSKLGLYQPRHPTALGLV